VKPRTLANISKLLASSIKLIARALKGAGDVSLAEIGVSSGREYGGSFHLPVFREVGNRELLLGKLVGFAQRAHVETFGRWVWVQRSAATKTTRST
jgi:hypothetical protein